MTVSVGNVRSMQQANYKSQIINAISPLGKLHSSLSKRLSRQREIHKTNKYEYDVGTMCMNCSSPHAEFFAFEPRLCCAKLATRRFVFIHILSHEIK